LNDLKSEPVFFNTSLAVKVTEYLKKQTYIDYNTIETFLKNNFNAKYPFGYVVINQFDEIVGFLGTMFSNREESETKYLYCNLHTWIIDKAYRFIFFSYSNTILSPIFEYNCTFFAKPTKSLIRLFLKKFDMKKLEMKYRVIFLLNFSNFLKMKKYKIEDNPLIVEKYLNKNDLTIYLDHKNLTCHKFIIIDQCDPSNNIFVIAIKKRKKKYFNVLEIIYSSNSEKLKENWSNISLKIAIKYNILFCGQNFLNEKESSIAKKTLISKDFKSEIVVKNLPLNFKFNTLYSEFVY